jgi:hypothetical protein
MDISNMDLAFSPGGRRGGSPIHNTLVELAMWLQNVAYKHRQRRQIPPRRVSVITCCAISA